MVSPLEDLMAETEAAEKARSLRTQQRAGKLGLRIVRDGDLDIPVEWIDWDKPPPEFRLPFERERLPDEFEEPR